MTARMKPVHVSGLRFRVNLRTNCRLGCKDMATSPQAGPIGEEILPWGGPVRCAECGEWVEVVGVTVEGPFVEAFWLEDDSPKDPILPKPRKRGKGVKE